MAVSNEGVEVERGGTSLLAVRIIMRMARLPELFGVLHKSRQGCNIREALLDVAAALAISHF